MLLSLNIARSSAGFIVGIDWSVERSMPSFPVEKLGGGAGPGVPGSPNGWEPFVGENTAEDGAGEPSVAEPLRSKNVSAGENPSGLPCWDVDSVDADERIVFLRMGRIHGGRDLADGRSCPEDSKGILVTEM